MLYYVSHSTGRGRLCWLILLKPWPHHSNLDKTLQGNSAFGILRITSTMVGTGLTRKNHFEVLNLYLAGFSLSNTCCIRSRKLLRFSSWSFSASSCAIPHPCLRTRSAIFSYRYFSFLPGLPAASLDISRFRWWNEQLEIMCIQNTDKNIRKICCKIRPDDLRG